MGSPHVLSNPPAAAIVGAGFMGPAHAEALRRIGVPIAGLLGSSPERARPVADRQGIGRVYRDFDELLADDAVGAVHIASPNEHHFEQARRALESGRHVVCEKPLAIDPEQTKALAELAERHPSQAAAVNYNIRHYPACLEMRDRVGRGDVGRVLSVTGSYTQDWLLKPTDYNWRVEHDGGTGLRAVADIGTHWMDLAQFVAGREIREVLADLATFHAERSRPTGGPKTFAKPDGSEDRETVPVKTEDYGAVLLRFEGGIRGSFHVSQTFAGRKNRLLLEVAGTEGSLVWDSETPDLLWIGRRDGPNALLPRDPALLGAAAAEASHYPGGHAEGFPDSFKGLFLALYRWIGEKSPENRQFPTFADGDRELRICAAIAASARERAWTGVAP